MQKWFQSLRGFGVGWSQTPTACASTAAVLVSIPERVWGGLERSHSVAGPAGQYVSIPERVWGGLEQSTTLAPKDTSAFQSLRGFGVGWSKSSGQG